MKRFGLAAVFTRISSLGRCAVQIPKDTKKKFHNNYFTLKHL